MYSVKSGSVTNNCPGEFICKFSKLFTTPKISNFMSTRETKKIKFNDDEGTILRYRFTFFNLLLILTIKEGHVLITCTGIVCCPGDKVILAEKLFMINTILIYFQNILVCN